MSISDETNSTMRRQGRALPLDLWPQEDRKAWNAACQPATRLKPGGRAGHLRPVTREDHAVRLLPRLSRPQWLAGTGWTGGCQCDRRQGRRLPCRTKDSREFNDAPLPDLQAPASGSIHGASTRLHWLLEIARDLALVARPRPKFDRLVLSDVLVAAGLKIIDEAEHSPKLTNLGRACRVRNGLMVALLGFCSIRRKNFADLEIGRSFVKIRNKWWIILRASETKEKRADERPVNELLTPIIEHYLSEYKPVLARSADPPPALWLSANDGKPLTHKEVSRIIGRCTLSTTAVRVTPHLFRTSSASTAAVYGGNNPHLASALLHHTDPSFTNQHYNRASCLSAAESFRKIVRRYEKAPLLDRNSSAELAD